MFNPKLRSALASTALVSAVTLLPLRPLGTEPRQPKEPKGRPATGSLVSVSPWGLLMQVLRKAGVTIDPEGVQTTPLQGEGSAAASTDPNGAP